MLKRTKLHGFYTHIDFYYAYLYNLNEEAQERYESLIVDFAESHGLTEELKAKDQMKWVELANYVANASKEIVESELIFR